MEFTRSNQITMKRYKTKADVRYVDIKEYIDLVKDNDIESIDIDFLCQRMMKIFYNINPKELRAMMQSEVVELIQDINVIMADDNIEFKNIIEMNGVKYGFIPNFSEITAGELIDLDDCYKNDDMVSATSILYRPIVGKVDKVGKYRIEPYTGYDNKFKDVTWDIVTGYRALFQRSLQILSHLTDSSTEMENPMK